MVRKTGGTAPYGAALQGMWLALEAQQVIALRLMKIAQGGPAAANEAHRMVAEKLDAAAVAASLATAAATRGGGDGGTDAVLRMLRRRVRANRKRLTRGG